MNLIINNFFKNLFVFLFLFLINSSTVYSNQTGDEIIAVVNDQVILRSEIVEEFNKIPKESLNSEYSNLTEKEILKRILDKLILDNLLSQATKRFGINISDIALTQGINEVAKRKKLTINELREKVINSGISYEAYVEAVRNKMAIDELFRTQFYTRVYVSEEEVESFIKSERASDYNTKEYDISEFLINDEEKNFKPEMIKKIYDYAITFGFNKAQKEFSKLNISINNIGKVKGNTLPDIFLEALEDFNRDGYTEIITSAKGFHILKLKNTNSQNEILIDEYKVRHILMTPDIMTSNQEIKVKLTELRNAIKNIEDFKQAAKRYSVDKASGYKGGDLGWVRTKSLVKKFSEIMIKTPLKKISDPFETKFGWHVLYVENKRTIDSTDEKIKEAARKKIRINKAMRERNEWLVKLKEQAYIRIKDF